MKLALFFTMGTSLKLWNDKGWLDGGVGIKSYNRWADEFETLYFLTYGNSQDLQYRRFLRQNVVVLPKKIPVVAWLYSLLIPFAYRRELRDVDIFFSAQMEGAWAAAIAKYLFRKKFVLRCGYQWAMSDFGPGWHKMIKLLVRCVEWLIFRAADFIIVTSEQARRNVIEDYGISPNRVEVIMNPVDTELFRPLLRTKIPESLVYVGRLEKEKNPMMLFEAIKDLNVNLTVFGSGSLERVLKDYAIEHKLRVTFRGDIPNSQLPEELNKQEILILSSLYDNNPKALLEAMGCGLAVIGTNVRGINEIIKHRKNGYLCDVSSEAMRECILEVINDSKLRAKMGEAARKYILNNCNLDNKIEREMRIFRSVVNMDVLSL